MRIRLPSYLTPGSTRNLRSDLDPTGSMTATRYFRLARCKSSLCSRFTLFAARLNALLRLRRAARVKTSIRIRLSKNGQLSLRGPLRHFVGSGIESCDPFRRAPALAAAHPLQRVGSLMGGGNSRHHLQPVKLSTGAIFNNSLPTPSKSDTCAFAIIHQRFLRHPIKILTSPAKPRISRRRRPVGGVHQGDPAP